MPIVVRNIVIFVLAIGILSVLFTIGAFILVGILGLVAAIVIWRKLKEFFGSASGPQYEDAVDVEFEIIEDDDKKLK